MIKRLLFAVATLIVAAGSAHAEHLNFSASLDGAHAPTETGSPATGAATLTVDTEARTIDVLLDVHGISLDDLFDHVIHAGIGPVHLHLYSENGDISLLVPFPYGPAYAATPDGFSLMVTGYSYAEGAALLHSEMSFEQFVSTLGSAFVYLNIHTDDFNDGAISGRLALAG